MSNVLKKITNRAKQIRRNRPGLKWSKAVSEATNQLKREGTIGGGSTQMSGHKKRTTKRRAKPARKRSITQAPYKVKSSSGLEGASISSLKSQAKKILKDQLGKKLAQKSLARLKRDKKKLGKEASAIRAQIIKFN